MAKVLIVCATRTGETLRIGELIAEGIRFSGHESTVVKINAIKNETDLQGYDALVLGSATYHGDMIQGMKTILFLAEKAELEGKVGGLEGRLAALPTTWTILGIVFSTWAIGSGIGSGYPGGCRGRR